MTMTKIVMPKGTRVKWITRNGKVQTHPIFEEDGSVKDWSKKVEYTGTVERVGRQENTKTIRWVRWDYSGVYSIHDVKSLRVIRERRR